MEGPAEPELAFARADTAVSLLNSLDPTVARDLLVRVTWIPHAPEPTYPSLSHLQDSGDAAEDFTGSVVGVSPV